MRILVNKRTFGKCREGFKEEFTKNFMHQDFYFSKGNQVELWEYRHNGTLYTLAGSYIDLVSTYTYFNMNDWEQLEGE